MKIALLGDLAFFGRYSSDSNSRVREYFQKIAKYLHKYDYVIGNLETPFVTDGKAFGAKSAYIRSNPVNVGLLSFLNVNVVNLANNHIFDYGLDGYRCTLETLAGEGVDYFGVEDRQIEINHENAQIALHGYCSYNTNPLGISRDGQPGVNRLHVAKVERKLLDNHQRGLLNIVSVHSGLEHINYPSVDDIRMARQFAEICPYVYYGHHPHVVQGIEVIRNALICYSLGNFCFDDVYTDKSSIPLIQQSDNNRTGLIVELDVIGGNVVQYQLTPIFLGRERLEVGVQGALDMIAGYSDALRNVDESYRHHRSKLINEYLSRRKKLRDLNWYLKRLNFNSVKLLLSARMNEYRYRKNIVRFLR